MSKRILAFVCMLTLLVCLLPVGAIAQTEGNTNNTYLVGYAKKDINPWANLDEKDPGDLLAVQLTGNGNDIERACSGMMDDNGDGEVGEGDGIFTTCTAITDTNGTTVLFITMDTLQGDPDLIKEIRNSIMNTLGADVINGNQIFVSGSHTHSGPSLQNAKNQYVSYTYTETDTSTQQTVTKQGSKQYYKYIIEQIVAAAVEAYDDQAPATMKRGSIDATDATRTLGYNDGKGYQMNFLRSHVVTATDNMTGEQVSYVYGPSYTTATGTPVLDKNRYTISASEHVADADDTMHLLAFDFEDSSKQPVVLLNWRAHPTTNSGDKTKQCVSGDYVNALRTELANNEYRAAFFQGAGANTVMTSQLKDSNDWSIGESSTIESLGKANTYGKILAEVAVECLKDATQLDCGDINIIQKTFTHDIQSVTDEMYDAALVAKKAHDEENTQAEKNKLFPYEYKVDGKEVFTVNSIFHATQLIKRYELDEKAVKDFTTQEIAAVSLGGSAVFVTAPNELSERYNINGSLEDQDNDWLKLIDENTYGTPFVLTHTNGSNGYLPNARNFDYNKDIQDIARIGIGSYEANTCRYARGAGEKLIAEYEEMLQILKGTETDARIITRTCEACGVSAEWKPLSYLQYEDAYLGSGHYYYTEDPSHHYSKTVRAGERLCIDLNGKSITTSGRSFSVARDLVTCGTLNLFDTSKDKTGSVTSINASSNPTNGTINVHGNLNIYGGTYKAEYTEEISSGVFRGGVVGVESTYDQGTKTLYPAEMHMYGGTVIGNDHLVKGTASSDNGVGAAIYVSACTLHIHNDAKITSGQVPEGGFGPCVALSNSQSSKVILHEGNASVDDIYFRSKNQSKLIVSGDFTGNVGLSYESEIANGTQIGSVENNADITGATFNLPVEGLGIYNNNGKLTAMNAVALIGGIAYDSFENAIAAYTGNSEIKLCNDITSDVNIGKDVCLDLNGHEVSGRVTVATECTLYCMDSQTDDYNIDDDAGYGKLTNVTGNVQGVSATAKRDDYLMIIEENGDQSEYSFHRMTLKLTHMTLSTDDAGIYFKSNFAGDRMVAERVSQFGVALSVQAVPTVDNLETKCISSKLTDFKAGVMDKDATSTLLKGVMKPGNAALINYRNANMPIYGRPYILTKDGEYFLGAYACRTFKEQTELADDRWDTMSEGQKTGFASMYERFSRVMGSWELPKLKAFVSN